MAPAKNILDSFKRCNVFVENPGNPGTVSVINSAEIIEFDIIGFMTEIPFGEGENETELVFFPWGAVRMLRPILPEGDE